MSIRATLSLGDDDKRVTFTVEDLCRHTMIFGSSGSGKTTRAYNPMLADMLGKMNAGAFIIAAKVEAAGEAVEIARRAGREALVIEPGSAVGLDLLSGSPDVDAMYFRDTFGRVGEEAKQWVDAAVARMKNALRMLQAAGEQYYTFEHLTGYCFDDKFAAMVRVQAADKLRSMAHDSDDAWTIREAMSYEDTRYLQFTPESRRAVQFAVSQLLEPLRDVAIAKTFGRKFNLLQMEEVFAGKVIVLHVPRTKYERAAQAIYTLAKRRFFTALENRRANRSLDQERPIVFGIDEYQLCISESDVQSLGIIRSAGCMVLGTTQGVSSLYSTLPKYHVDAALQNFTQKIFFKTDDDDTLAVLERATKHNVEHLDTSSLFSMSRNQAICHVTVGDDSYDAILTMKPLFVTPNYVAGAGAAGARPVPAGAPKRSVA
jgi:type IV secretory pathway TraG/TraD family ATPase VirD4